MRVALVQVCVDERLNHELVRIQVKHKLSALYLSAQRVLILNEIGGNLGDNFRNTLDLFLSQHDTIVLAAVLHHDDCLTDRAGLRQPLEETCRQIADLLTQRGVSCFLSSGNIYTSNNHVFWLKDNVIKGSPARR